MNILKVLYLYIFTISTAQSFCVLPSSCVETGEHKADDNIRKCFKNVGYVEICNTKYETRAFDTLYSYFDEFISFLQKNPAWEHKLYHAKERFIRSRDRSYYSTDFFGFYDESSIEGRRQISFYYSIHFHEFICSRYPECNHIPEIINFLAACSEIQKPCEMVFINAAIELGLETIFSSYNGHPPVLLKVIKYLPLYTAIMPHYDGTVFSLFLDSTDNQSLLLAPYKTSFTRDDFSPAVRKYPRASIRHSILLIPGTLITEFSMYPTPHIVIESGNVRYATIAFAMRPNYTLSKSELSELPTFKH